MSYISLFCLPLKKYTTTKMTDVKPDTTFKEHITLNLIQPNYVEEIQTSIKGRTRWRSVGMFFETASKLFLGIGSVLSFASGVYNNQNMSFISGSITTLSLVCLQYASFSYKESKESTTELNILLQKLNWIRYQNLYRKRNTNNPMTNVENGYDSVCI
jgi:hypothetical protein